MTYRYCDNCFAVLKSVLKSGEDQKLIREPEESIFRYVCLEDGHRWRDLVIDSAGLATIRSDSDACFHVQMILEAWATHALYAQDLAWEDG